MAISSKEKLLALVPVLEDVSLTKQMVEKSGVSLKNGFFDAAILGVVPVMELLVEKHGIDVNVRGSTNDTAAHRAAGHNSLEALQWLVAKGADVNAKEEDGYTPLHFAAAQGSSVEVVKYLVEHGADINTRTHTGSTPLHFAASSPKSSIAVLECLISLGAEINAKNDKGGTPFRIANTDEKKRILSAAGGSRGDSGSSGCLVFFAALGTLLTSGICGLALLAATVWNF